MSRSRVIRLLESCHLEGPELQTMPANAAVRHTASPPPPSGMELTNLSKGIGRTTMNPLDAMGEQLAAAGVEPTASTQVVGAGGAPGAAKKGQDDDPDCNWCYVPDESFCGKVSEIDHDSARPLNMLHLFIPRPLCPLYPLSLLSLSTVHLLQDDAVSEALLRLSRILGLCFCDVADLGRNHARDFRWYCERRV